MKHLKLTNFRNLLKVVLLWRLGLFVVAFASVLLIQKRSFPFPYTDSILIPTGFPQWIWGFGNFDGVHYIRTALWGYISEYSQAFFPLYPLLMSFGSVWNVIGLDPRSVLLINGLLISLVGFGVGLYFYKKILDLDFKDNIVSLSVMLLLLFPTSFYFVSIYTEGLFLFLSCFAIYLIRKKLYLYSGILICLATSTRITGIFLIAIYAIEMFLELRKDNFSEKAVDLFPKIFGLFISIFGVLLYMFFLYYNYNNPLYFLTAQPVFGASRQVDQFVLLPQVFYRYLKILLTVPFFTSQFFTAIIELMFSVFGVILLIISFKKIRFSYWIFSFCVFLLPTLTGTLSSMPRYVLLLFLLYPALVMTLKNKIKYVIITFSVLQVIFCGLFILGFWIA